MTCYRFKTAIDGVPGYGVVCMRGERRKRCAGCGELGATHQCDWKLAGKKAGKTCDAWICEACKYNVGPDKDLCPPHARLWDKHPKNPKNAGATT